MPKHAVEIVARDFFAGQDRTRGGPPGHLCTADYQATIGSTGGMDLAGHHGFASAFYAGFPDAMHTIEDVVVTESAAAVRFILRGTHTGNFFGIPATSLPVVVAANVILHLRDDRVSELKGVFDEAGLLRQIGVLPQG